MTTLSPPALNHDLWSALAEQQGRQRQVVARDNQVYAEPIQAKADRDRASYEDFRALDRKLWAEQQAKVLKENLLLAQHDAGACRAEVPGCEAAAAEALAKFRTAEDRARQATEAARLAREAHKAAMGTGTPDEIRTALRDSKDAAEVAKDILAALEDARREHQQADAELARARADHREAQQQAERALEIARKNAASPVGEAPVSNATIRACWAYMRRPDIWNALDAETQQRVNAAKTNNGNV